MNEKREKAFYDWWMFKASEDGRATPSDIWDAACDWMLDEVRWRVERAFEREEDANGNGKS